MVFNSGITVAGLGYVELGPEYSAIAPLFEGFEISSLFPRTLEETGEELLLLLLLLFLIFQ